MPLNELMPSPSLKLDRSIALSDTTMAAAFCERYAMRVRYCPDWRKWLVWDGQRWRTDESGQAMELAKELALALEAWVRSTFRQEEDGGDGKARSRKLADARAFQGERRLTSLLKLARSNPAIVVRVDTLDAKPMLLNSRTATINLETGEARPHDPSDLLTQMTGCEWPESGIRAEDPPRYLRMLTDIFAGSTEMIEYMQRALGYSFTGSTRERVMVILFGRTMNGKSTLEGLTRRIAGDYAITTRPATFMAAAFENEGKRAAMAGLRGKRIVQMGESRETDRLDEGIVKSVTGGDAVEVKTMGGNPFTFQPIFKLWLATNHLPAVSNTDEAVWNRLHPVPFTRNIAEVMKARGEAVLGTDEAVQSIFEGEGPRILAWIVRGCLQWQQQRGLNPPPAVTNAREHHRQEMDPVTPFVEECCDIGDNRQVRVTELRQGYFRWCRDNNHQPVPPKVFDGAVAAKFPRRKSSGYETWHGITLGRAS